MALKISVAKGIAAFVLTILTDHQLGLFRIIPYQVHLMVDFSVAIIFILATFIFSFKGIDAYYYWINGAAVLTVVGLHKPARVV
ncbi:hypothetical protein ABW636_00035 [Aquimarina sp. 2201CG1-2-11]|uniref:hypothetical protein n=1 Tax=Aquimarina discodermiae TaxID=3231043 RepID=UPI0034623DA6